jgi:hypothetical protein
LSNFSKEFYHWLAVSGNEAQRVRVCLVALAGTKLVKENEPEENPQDFPSTHKTSN